MQNISNKPIFIVGCERSGTTVVRLILHTHPNIAIPPQTKILKKLYKRRLIFRDLSKKQNRSKIAEYILSNYDKKTKLVDLGIDSHNIYQNIQSSGNSIGAVGAIIFQEYAKKHHKLRWGDKRPYYIKYLRQLLHLFPDAQIIHIIRDPRDAVASLLSMSWWKKNLMNSILNWKEAVRRGSIMKKHLPSDQYFELRYEDFIDNPEQWIRQICGFLNEEFYPQMLQFQATAGTAIPNYKMEWHSATKQALSAKSIGRWKNDLTRQEACIVEKITGKEMIDYGYQLSANGNSMSFSEYIQYVITAIQYYGNVYFVSGADRILEIIYP
ncbi:MAG: sulfotransferase, partial [Candidatus Neomarinimicrobiota bacterium]|nr:sulfotransferase [Candidatus Neomarinimicrobiota bacterium]